jgi:hypothetical protein
MAGPQFDEAALRAIAGRLGNAFKVIGGNGASQTKDRSQVVLQALDDLVKQEVLVGIPSDKADRQDGESLNNAARLYISEYGAPEANIPARPTVMPGIEAAREEINKRMVSVARAAMAGNAQSVDQGMHAAGLAAADSIKEMINSNTPPPLAERTLADRRARGVTRTNTLVDEAEMRNAVTYIVRDKSRG